MPRDPLEEIFQRAMQRLEDRLYESVDHILDTAEDTVDKIINQTQSATRGVKQSKAGTKKRRSNTHPRTRPPHHANHASGGPTTLYDDLEVSPHASRATIEAAWRSLCKRYHPDVNKLPEAEKRMKQINAAWTVLNDDKKRKEYDRGL